MDNLEEVVIENLQESIYLKPFSMRFKQNGKDRKWDLIRVHDSVAIVIYNITRNVLIFVKQFRPAVYFNCIPEKERMGIVDVKKYPASLGITIELCAGIVDKDIPLVEIAKEEVVEECGYDVPINSLQEIGRCRSGVGQSGGIQTTYYCEVTDDMKIHSGGGVDDEIIDVIEMTVDEVKSYINKSQVVNSPPSFMYGIYWFLFHKVKCIK